MGTLEEKLDYLQTTKAALRTAIVNKGGECSSETPFRQYAGIITDLPSGSSEGVYEKEDYYSYPIRYSLAYLANNNPHPEQKRVLLCGYWNTGDQTVFYVGGPKNYRVEIVNSATYTGSDPANATAVTHKWSFSNGDVMTDGDSRWDAGFGIAVIYMDGDVFDQSIPNAKAVILDNCSAPCRYLAGAQVPCILEAINDGYYSLESAEDEAALRTIMPEYIQPVVINYENVTDTFRQNNLKHIGIKSCVTSSTSIKFGEKLEEIFGADILFQNGLKIKYVNTGGSEINNKIQYIEENISFKIGMRIDLALSCYTKLNSMKEITITGSDNAEYLFYRCPQLKKVEKIDLVNCGNLLFNRAFLGCCSLEDAPEITGAESILEIESLFSECFNLKKVPVYAINAVESLDSVFSDCFSLKQCPAWDIGNVTSAANIFLNCVSLEAVRLKNIGCDLDISASTKFTAETLVEVMNNLKTLSGKTLTMGADNLAKLTVEQKAIATNKGWTLA